MREHPLLETVALHLPGDIIRTMLRSLITSTLLLQGLALGATELPRLISEYRADERSLEAAWNLPWSELQQDRLQHHVESWQQRLETVTLPQLERDDQVDWLLLRNHLSKELEALRQQRAQLAEMKDLLPFRSVIQKLVADQLERRAANPPQAAEQLAGLLKPLEDLKKQLSDQKSADAKKSGPNVTDKLPKITPVLALRAASATNAIRDSLAEWFKFHDSFQPAFGWWVRQPQGKLMEALEAHTKFLREEIADQKGKPEDPLVGDPIGAEALAANISGELLPYTAEELIAIGEEEFTWCETQMRDIANQLGTDIIGVLQKIKAAHVPPGAQASLVQAEAERAIQFLKQHDLVTIPPLCEETWRMQMIPPDQQKTMPYAVYSSPAISIAYATDAMSHEDKMMSMRGNNRHFTRIVTPHELIPGHHLQRFMADRNHPWRSLFSTPFYVEGWALYWEMQLWDKGYAASVEDKAGMLFWRMHRCARIIVSLKFHLGKMTPAEMVDYLVQRVGHEKMGATSEVRRYINGNYGPLYQAGYMLGGMQLRALREEMIGPDKLTEKAFHDAVLTQGPMPIEVLRAALSKEPLSKDWKSTWRFQALKP